MRLADSNILLYAVSADPAEAGKRARAIEVLVLQRRFLNLVSFCLEIASRKARPQSCQARSQVALKRRSGSLSGQASL